MKVMVIKPTAAETRRAQQDPQNPRTNAMGEFQRITAGMSDKEVDQYIREHSVTKWVWVPQVGGPVLATIVHPDGTE